MDSPIVTSLFRQLSHLRARQCLRTTGYPSISRKPQSQNYSHGAAEANGRETKWQTRTALLNKDKIEDYERFTMVTAEELRGRKERPKRVKMLLRDFIEGSYNLPLFLAS